MEKQTRFSIITPVYNTKKEFLIECFNSSLNQKYDNYEVIIVDDGSNAETKNVLENYKNNKNVKLIHQDNKGIVGARLTGLANATGDYVYFLDSDDICNANLLNILNNIVIKYNPDVILHDCYRFTDSIENIESETHFLNEGVVSKEEVLTQLLQLHINGITNKVARRELYNDMEKSIDLSIINGEDLQQSTYVILNGNSFYQTYEQLEYWRVNNEQRDYYDVTRLHEINFLIPTYKMVFEQNQTYNNLLNYYLNASKKAVLYIAFQICQLKTNKTHALLNELNEQEINKLLSRINEKKVTLVDFVYKQLINKNYIFIKLASILIKLI